MLVEQCKVAIVSWAYAVHVLVLRFFFKSTFPVDHCSFYRHANIRRKSLQQGRKLKANGSS